MYCIRDSQSLILDEYINVAFDDEGPFSWGLTFNTTETTITSLKQAILARDYLLEFASTVLNPVIQKREDGKWVDMHIIDAVDNLADL